MKKTFLIALAATALAAPAYADHHGMSKAEHHKMHRNIASGLQKSSPTRRAVQMPSAINIAIRPKRSNSSVCTLTTSLANMRRVAHGFRVSLVVM
jgi:hypothetical protein